MTTAVDPTIAAFAAEFVLEIGFVGCATNGMRELLSRFTGTMGLFGGMGGGFPRFVAELGAEFVTFATTFAFVDESIADFFNGGWGG